jgi:hypothetical protein
MNIYMEHEQEKDLGDPGSLLGAGDIAERIVEGYNKSIELCRKSPESRKASEDVTICGVEEVLKHPVAKRTRSSSHLSSGDYEEPQSFDKLMCGCRLTSLVLFIMLILNISIPSGIKFHSLYGEIMSNLSPNVREIISGYIPRPKMEELISDGGQHIKSELEPDIDINIVNIFKYIPGFEYQSLHSFIIRNNQGIYELISSWYSGGESSATPLIYKTFTFDELKRRLTCKSLLNKGNCEEIFGEGNYFEKDSILKILFISKDGVLNGLTAKKHKKKKHTKRKKKRKSKQRRKKSKMR